MAMLTQTLSLERGCNGKDLEGHLRDPSFSSYLSGTEECYVINLSNNSFAPSDNEIDVFRAEKYFNESLDDEKPQVIELPPVQDLVSGAKTKALSGASSVRSVSSWNSQGALLHPKLRNPSINAASRVKARSYLGSFRCRCVCSDKNSVAVDEYHSYDELLHPTHSAAKEPVKRGVSPITAEGQCSASQRHKRETNLSSKDFCIEELAMKPRKSLDAFRSPLFQRGYKPFSFEKDRKLTLNWEDCLSRPAEVVFPIMTNGAYAHSDSDSSSDLFELEDFTSKQNPFLFRNMSDSTMPTAYAPSEASIEWSVVTASAADFPITSDFEELRSYKNTTNSNTTSKNMNQKVTAIGDKPRRVSSSFLACNSQKSVNVVTNEKNTETKTRKSKGSPQQVNSAQLVAKLIGAEAARNIQIGFSDSSQGQSKSLNGPNVINFQ